jgi:carbonic anhydrase/acetyltransferase-like protein (isoleucine patch superfamily)
MPVYELNRIRPLIGDGTWIAPSADIIGDVTIGTNCYIGFGAVIRGDFGPIIIGNETLIEDNVVIHTASRTQIGIRVIVGHMAMIHDAQIEDGALIGMKAMISEGTVIGAGAIIAQQSLLKKNQKVPPRNLYAGAPAAFKKEVSDEYLEILDAGIRAYMDLRRLYHQTFKPV